MVTHTQNLCSALTHPMCPHTTVNTHTPWTHTRSSGQPFMLRCPGSSRGFGALLKGTSIVVLRVKSSWTFTPLTYNCRSARDSNSQPFDYESNSQTIRPWHVNIRLAKTNDQLVFNWLLKQHKEISCPHANSSFACISQAKICRAKVILNAPLFSYAENAMHKLAL